MGVACVRMHCVQLRTVTYSYHSSPHVRHRPADRPLALLLLRHQQYCLHHAPHLRYHHPTPANRCHIPSRPTSTSTSTPLPHHSTTAHSSLTHTSFLPLPDGACRRTEDALSAFDRAMGGGEVRSSIRARCVRDETTAIMPTLKFERSAVTKGSAGQAQRSGGVPANFREWPPNGRVQLAA